MAKSSEASSSTETSLASNEDVDDGESPERQDSLQNRTVPVVEQKVATDETQVVIGDDEKLLRTRTAVALLLAIFLCSLIALLFVYYSFPHLEPDEAQHVKFPMDIDDAKHLGLVLSRYKDRYFLQVLGGVFVTYLFLQTFAIPGSIFLSIVSGYLFPFPVALILICFCSATGASFCYLLSYLVGRRLIHTYLPESSANWASRVKNHRSNILSYIVFLRITPFLPNWFINIVSPVIDVHLKPFWIGTFIGVAPPSFVAIQAGTTLQQLTSTTEALNFQSVALLIMFAFLSVLPVIMKNRKVMQSYFSGDNVEENEKEKNNETNQTET